MRYKEATWGTIPEHWNISTIKLTTELVTDYVANGSFAALSKNVTYRDTEDEAILIRLADYHNGFSKNFVFLDNSSYEFLRKSKLYGNEIIIANVGANAGTVFKCPKLDYKMSLGPNAIMVKMNGHNDFYYYWFSSPFGQFLIKSIISGSAQPKFNKTDFRNLPVPVPPIPEQKAIAATLSCLDDKIELNNKINANLEAQAQAIFKSWFVDFEPFRSGEFVDSELGPIPKGWRAFTLDDIAHYVKERIPVNHCNIENYVSTENMLANRQGVVNASSLPTTSGVSRYAINDVLVSNIRPYFKKIWFADKVGGCSNDVLVIRAKNEALNGFLYCLLYSDGFFEYMTATSKGTKMPRGDKAAIMRYTLTIPISFENDIYVKKFNQMIIQYQNKIHLIQKENQVLAALRDTLLPKLMSGEIKVPLEAVYESK